MNKIIRSLAEEGILAALDQNFTEEMACFGRALPGAKLHEDEELTWFLTGPSGPNGVLLTDFHTDDSAYIETRIQETIQHFQHHQLQRFGWTVGPSSYPPDLANFLEEQGLEHRDTTNCMALALTQPRPPATLPPDFQISEVTNEEELLIKCEIEKLSFNSSEVMAAHYRQSYINNGFGPHKAWHHYIGWYQNKPVTIAAFLLHAGIAGIYGVGTLPEARRKGFARAMLQYVLSEIERLGYAVAILSPTDLSLSLYQQLGFRNFCQLYHYTYFFQDAE